MKLFKTLRFRLSLLFIFSLTILAVIILSFLLQSINDQRLNKIDQNISESADHLKLFIEEEILEDLEFEDDKSLNNNEFPKGFIKLLEDEFFEHLLHSPLQDSAYVLFNSKGKKLINKTLTDQLAGISFPDLNNLPYEEVTSIDIEELNYPIRFYLYEIDQGYKFMVFTSLENYTKEVSDLRTYFVSAALLLILTGGLAAWITVGRSMKGVHAVTSTADSFGAGNFNARVEWHGKGSEIKELVSHFNDMASQTQRLIKELNDVTNNIAHDLRTPITRMRGFAENAIQKGDTDLAPKIIEECERQTEIIEDILNLAESQAGVLSLKIESLSLNKLIEEILDIYHPLAETESCKIILEADSNFILKIDKRLIQRVIANLLDNALKYSQQSDIFLSLSGHRNEVLIRIKDQGPGIIKSERENIFKRFYRGDHSRHSKGSGLGLSIALAYTESLGGTLTLEDSEKGCSFLISLPKG